MTIAAEALDLATLAILCAAPVWLACWVAHVVEQSCSATSSPDARAAYALAAGVGQGATLARVLHARGWARVLVPHPTSPTGHVLAWRPNSAVVE